MMNYNEMIKELTTRYYFLSDTINRLDEALDEGQEVENEIQKLSNELLNVLDAIKALTKARKNN